MENAFLRLLTYNKNFTDPKIEACSRHFTRHISLDNIQFYNFYQLECTANGLKDSP